MSLVDFWMHRAGKRKWWKIALVNQGIISRPDERWYDWLREIRLSGARGSKVRISKLVSRRYLDHVLTIKSPRFRNFGGEIRWKSCDCHHGASDKGSEHVELHHLGGPTRADANSSEQRALTLAGLNAAATKRRHDEKIIYQALRLLEDLANCA